MTTTSGNLSKMQTYGLFKVFNSNSAKIEPLHQKMYSINPSERGYEEAVQSTALTLVPEKPEGVKATSEDIKQSFVTKKYHKTYSRVFKITQEALDDNLYKKDVGLNDMALLRDAFARTKEFNAANVFNLGQSSGLTYGDGQPMLSASHPSEIGAVRSNLSAYSSLTEAAVEDAYINIERSKSLEGNVMPLKATKLLIAPNRRYEAQRIFNSALRTGTANNDSNVFKDSVEVIVNPYFSFNTGFVFLTDHDDKTLVMFERQAKQMKALPLEEDLVYRFICSERYSFVLFDFLKTYGNVSA